MTAKSIQRIWVKNDGIFRNLQCPHQIGTVAVTFPTSESSTAHPSDVVWVSLRPIAVCFLIYILLAGE